MNLKEKVKQLPSTPGVYLMKDSQGSVIYVGKSKNLKSRVGSYFQHSSQHSNKVIKLVHHLKDFDLIQTDTEFEAFMLECKLIQEIQPLYNRLMKNPRSYTYIRIKMNNSYKRIELVSEIEEEDGNLYFGPYTSKGRTEKAIQGLKEMFKLDCNQTSFRNSPCFNYSLGLCMGMCFDNKALDYYHLVIDKIIGLLEGNDRGILEEMKGMMIQASDQFDFEGAAKIRDVMEAVQSLLNREKVIQFTEEGKNIVMLEPIGDDKIKLFLIRRNKVLFSKVYILDDSNPEKLVEQMKSTVVTYFSKNEDCSKVISKEEIDEANIIYRYINSRADDCLIIPDEWLKRENESRIEQALLQLIN